MVQAIEMCRRLIWRRIVKALATPNPARTVPWRRLAVLGIVVTASLDLFPWLPTHEAMRARACEYELGCARSFDFINKDREVFGDVSTECPPTLHSVPWGNWGVDSAVSSFWDGDQFAGWYEEDNHRQWNSCTTEWPYTRPSWYYNANDGYSQVGDPPSEELFGRWQFGVGGETCEEIYDDYVITVEDAFMELLELDPYGSNLWVATLWYPDIETLVDCSGAYTCVGTSDWYSPNSGATDTTALVKMHFYTWGEYFEVCE